MGKGEGALVVVGGALLIEVIVNFCSNKLDRGGDDRRGPASMPYDTP